MTVGAASRLVLGTVQLGQPYGIVNTAGQPPPQTAIAMVRAADAAGVGALDTAPSYGIAEELIGASAVATPVITKLARELAPADSIELSRKRLQRDRLDLVLLHEPSLVRHDPGGVIAGAMELVLAGAVGGLGASIYTADELEAVIDDRRFVAVQVPASVADQRLVGAIARAGARGLAVYVRSVFLQGVLLGAAGELPDHLRGLAPVVEQLDELTEPHSAGRRALLVSFVRDLPGVSGVLIGVATPGQVDDALAAIAAPAVTEAVTARLAGWAHHPVPTELVDPRCWSS